MLSKQHIKLINSLTQKKYRSTHQQFIVEGVKSIKEFLNSKYTLIDVFTTATVFDGLPKPAIEISEAELKKISQFKTPNTALALFSIPNPQPLPNSGLVVGLDAVRDPGNLGTIIRLCDWFGVQHLVCSPTTVDCYNPKVVQASMGSLTRVTVNYVDISAFLKTTILPVFGTFMSGTSIYNHSLPKQGVIILGNEANGISKTIEDLVHHKISIPQFGEVHGTESLNVANAAAIVLSEFMRR